MIEQLWTLGIAYGSRVLLSLLFLFIGLKVIKKISDMVANRLAVVNVDASLRSFMIPLFKTSLQVLLIIAVASMLGAEMTSFVAIIGAISFAIGLALQGSLSNFAGGVLILVLKPFKVDDFIDAAGFTGTVKEIQIFYTVLVTPDNRKIIVPNASLSNSSVVNFSAHDTRRLEFKFGVSYDSDVLQVKEILNQVIAAHELILEEPAPMVVLSEHGESALVFTVRAWCERVNFWDIHFQIIEQVKLAFDANGISIPYPQMDVHIKKD